MGTTVGAVVGATVGAVVGSIVGVTVGVSVAVGSTSGGKLPAGPTGVGIGGGVLVGGGVSVAKGVAVAVVANGLRLGAGYVFSPIPPTPRDKTNTSSTVSKPMPPSASTVHGMFDPPSSS